jgi:hypothetical protein
MVGLGTALTWQDGGPQIRAGRRQRAQVRAVVEPDDMASDGLTDREIGDRLFLSPRTVSSHLYRSYPKLGVASRHQLRDVIARASTPAPAHAAPEARPFYKSL